MINFLQQTPSTDILIPGHHNMALYETWKFHRDFVSEIDRRYHRYGEVFRWQPILPIVFWVGAEANRAVLSSEQTAFSASLGWEFYIGRLFQGGLLNLEGHHHRAQRRILAAAFRPNALKAYMQLSQPIVNEFVGRLDGSCPDIYPVLKNLTLRIALRTLFGLQDGHEVDECYQPMIDLVAGSIAVLRFEWLPGTKYARAIKARRFLEQRLKSLLKQRRRSPTSDMLGILCQATDQEGNQLSDQQIINQLVFIMMAAHDTTASTLTSTIFELGRRPELQRQVREHFRMHGHPATYDRAACATSLPHWVLKEVLRLHTPLKVMPRITTKEVMVGKFSVPKGTRVSVVPAYCHRMSSYWQEPLAFNPERFDGSHEVVPYSYVPFGGGIHTCLGQTFAEQVVLLTLYQLGIKREWRLQSSALVAKVFQQVPIQIPKSAIRCDFRSV